MKTLYSLFIALLLSSTLVAQNIPVDFEATGFGASWTWTVFENDTNPALEIVPNPDPTGYNGSAMVAKFTALQAGQPFAGCETSHGAGIGSFTIDTSNSTIRIMVWKSVISDVGIKLVRNDNWSLGEIKIPNTKTNEWEQITYDFSAHMGNTYDQIVIFPDFNARTADQVIYFDNIYGPEGVMVGFEGFEQPQFQVFPNPAQAHFSLRSEQNMEQIEVFDPQGKLMFRQEQAGKALKVSMDSWPSGLYLVKIGSQGKTSIQKVLKH